MAPSLVSCTWLRQVLTNEAEHRSKEDKKGTIPGASWQLSLEDIPLRGAPKKADCQTSSQEEVMRYLAMFVRQPNWETKSEDE